MSTATCSYKLNSNSDASSVCWRKVLYKRQPGFPDNYVDVSFLDEMGKNVNVRQLAYWQVVGDAGAITQQVSSIFIFVAIFCNLLEISSSSLDSSSSPEFLFAVSLVFSLAGYAVISRLDRKKTSTNQRSTNTISSSRRSNFRSITSSGIISLLLLGLSPILKTLTKDISDDTIWALTFCMFIANLCFHNYGVDQKPYIEFPNSLSINAAIFASVLLGSLLQSSFAVFSLILFSMVLFGLFPNFRRQIKTYSQFLDTLITISLVCVASNLLLYVSQLALIIYLVLITFITFLAPLLLVLKQAEKNEITGPWDEARIQQSSSTASPK